MPINDGVKFIIIARMSNNPFETSLGKTLSGHYQQLESDGFNSLPGRNALRFECLDMYFDFSRHLIDSRGVDLLIQWSKQLELIKHRDALFGNNSLNLTEKRSVSHTTLRSTNGRCSDKQQAVQDTLHKMTTFCGKVHAGTWTGYSGQAITDVVNIGVGGSDLGARVVCEALQDFKRPNINVHFLADVDGADLLRTLGPLNVERTLFIITSKTFTTRETLLNAEVCRTWYKEQGGDLSNMAAHFVGVTADVEAARKFGIQSDNIYPMWDWVGGRFSVWSAVGLPVMLAIGAEAFAQFLSGAEAVDTHFIEAPEQENIPILMALLGIWNINFGQSRTHAVIPYNQSLRLLPTYLQQLEMESNGKSVNKAGETIDYHTAPVIWGGAGINGQHAYFQMLHQGTQSIPIDIICAINEQQNIESNHHFSLANVLAQSAVLAKGKSIEMARTEGQAQGLDSVEVEYLAAHQSLPGNRPSTLILLKSLTPESLGKLLALYEHKVFVQGHLWNINSFDQWGVEEGKRFARTCSNMFSESGNSADLDEGTIAALNFIKKQL